MEASIQGFRLSPQQRHLWLLQNDGRSAAIQSLVSLAGSLRIGLLEEAFLRLAGRHEILRTAFRRAPGLKVPFQVIEDRMAVAWRTADLSHLEAEAQAAALADLAAEELRQPFDLERGTVLRGCMVILGSVEFRLLVTLPALCADLRSLANLVADLGVLYAEAATGEAVMPAAEEERVQYLQFAEWQNQILEEAEAEQARQWGESTMEGDAVAIPYESEEESEEGGAAAVEPVSLSAGTLAGLETVAERYGTSIPAVLLATWQVLLWRLTNQPQAVLGTLFEGRGYDELKPAIGPFAKYLPVRCSVEGAASFGEVLRRMDVAYGEAASHLDHFAWSQDGEDERGRFAILFDWEERPAAFAAGGVTFAVERQGLDSEPCKLKLAGVRCGDELSVELRYDPRVLLARSAARLAAKLARLLDALIRDPQSAPAGADLMTGEERTELAGELRRTTEQIAIELPSASLAELFVDAARRDPKAVAVELEGERLSYGELDRRSNQLARHLVSRGAGRGAFVGLCLERSIDILVAILGVLKSGAAYVPLDPAYPRERLAFTLEDSGVALVLTQTALLEAFPAGLAPVVCLDAERERIGEENGDALAARPTEADLAYVIYTSGSTGRPKGVGVTHGNVARLLAATAGEYGFGPEDVWTLFHSYAFDVSVWEIWGALLYGGRLVVVPYWVSRSPEAFYELLAREGVTVLCQTPSAFRQFIWADEVVHGRTEPQPALSLRLVIFAGEALHPAVLAPWFERHGDERPRLYNMYGITETTVHVTWRLMRRTDLAAPSVIGQAIPGWGIYLLDRSLEPVPAGVDGEILVGGGVAVGYLGRPDLTAERFVPDPFSARPGARLYRSGDLARWLPGGDLEYLGRIDHQVKVRGYRIELGEIEAVLRRHPAVREAVVVAREDERGEKRLVAYVVERRAGTTFAELRAFLQQHLPEPMIPSAAVVLDALPLTPNGKLDARALPAPGTSRPELEAAYVSPRTPAEEVLAAIWAQVLGVDQVGIDDNFFSMGGDSIRSVRAVALAKERGFHATVEELFEHQTIRNLGFVVRTSEGTAIPAVRTRPFGLISERDRARLPEGLDDAYPLTTLQAGMLYHMELSHETPAYHNVATWKVRAPFGREVFLKAVERVVARHPVLRTSFDVVSYERPLQLVHSHLQLPVALHDLRDQTPEEQKETLEAFWVREHHEVFDLAEPPYLRFAVHQRTDDTFQLTITEHHAILDGWSLTSTITEVFEIYLSLMGSVEPRVEPPLATLFRDYVQLEHAALESREVREYWRRQLADAQPSPLPRWPRRFRPEFDSLKGKVYVDIPAEQLGALRNLARSIAVPLKSVLLAIHLKMLSWATGRDEVLSGLVTNGRPEQLDGEQVRGLFLNSVPFRFAVADGSWADLIRDTFEAERKMLPFRRYPLAALQQQWGRQRLFDAAFTYVHFHSVARLLSKQLVEILADDERDFSYNSFLLSVAFFLSPTKDQVRITLEYAAAEFCREQIEAVGRCFEHIVAGMAANPLARHRSDPLMTEGELRQILQEWGGAARAPEIAGTLPALFAAQAGCTPHATAVVCGGESLTYGELEARANQLARALLRRGLRPEQPVGVALERSLSLVVSLLAVVKAGCAYVPLDPALPAERLEYLCADALGERPQVITEERLAERFPRAAVLCVDRDAAALAAEAPTAPAVWIDVESLAYVIYTSGSTGQAKGVGITHANVVRLFSATADRFNPGPDDVWTLFHSYSFDFSVWELWGALLYGGRLVVVPYEVSRSPEAFHELLVRERVTVINQTPAAFGQLIAAEQAGAAAEGLALRLVIFGGEALNVGSLGPWVERHGLAAPRLVNMYGITETTVHTTVYELSEDDFEDPGRSPIGGPLADTRLYVLDSALLPIPVGAAGELYVGGPGLARGYLGRPALTAERFVPDALSGEPGARLYRSGDLVSFRADGNLEYLGRVDRQVKVRGFRIELGEIEAALHRLPEVREAVALTRKEETGDAFLVAYLVPESGATLPPTADLRARLLELLPDYMVPAAFVPLPALPLTPNGKVDRRALPAPGESRGNLRAEISAPQSELQKTIAKVWQEVLKVDEVGIYDSFFDLGGNSLRLFEVCTRLREACKDRRIELIELMKYPTIASLSEHLASREGLQAVAGMDDRTAKLQRGREQMNDQFERMRRAPR
ncbi:MAG TPA: amino acid adenylation domain-containing protein [Thermoanaerobaculia bacterium]|jgi:amino acid adenylation domain-containing protein|nr:amino acid adenylation domain-containing protein [Thermoanaerobaculia bacterium]